MGRPVVHFEIMGKNGKELQDFYSKLFAWKVDANNPMNYGVVSGEEGGIGGGIGQTQEGPPNYVTVYVQVDDLQACLDQVEKLGGKTLVPPTEIPGYVTFAMFADPAGNSVGVVKG